ncbi:serine hydrolase domain-containing protein [Sporobolomyces salmoneus]|uniref:serine hydrolase domain-containing protein n=1 Tax=Sporobolomyces salmoneus TaxID=183962 RepID=UPI0031728E6E
MSPDPANLSKSIQKLLDDAVSKGTAPGLVATVFNKDILASAQSGVASIKDKSQKFTLDTIIWPASAAKPFVSLLVLILVEKNGIDLDSHEELVKFLPELGKDWPGTRIWKVIDGKDENGEYKYRDAKVGITLRHLLTHSIGSSLHFNSEHGKKFYDESLKTGKTHMQGYIEAYNEPRAHESGEAFGYGLSAEWLGVFVSRINKTSFRKAAQTLLFKPLNLPQDTIEVFRTPRMNEDLAEIVAKLPDGNFVSLPEPGFDTPQYEDMPPDGMSVLGNAPFWCSISTFTQGLQALLNKTAPPGGKPLISEQLWEEATTDDYKRRGVSIQQDPFMVTTEPTLSTDLPKWSEIEEGADQTLGWNMFQQAVHRSKNAVGFRPNVVEWSGLANTYYFLDHERGIGCVISTQFLPWGEKGMIDLKNEFFKLVFDYSSKQPGTERSKDTETNGVEGLKVDGLKLA